MKYEQTTMSMNEEDQKKRATVAKYATVIDTWRRGANEIIKENKLKVE